MSSEFSNLLSPVKLPKSKEDDDGETKKSNLPTDVFTVFIPLIKRQYNDGYGSKTIMDQNWLESIEEEYWLHQEKLEAFYLGFRNFHKAVLPRTGFICERFQSEPFWNLMRSFDYIYREWTYSVVEISCGIYTSSLADTFFRNLTRVIPLTTIRIYPEMLMGLNSIYQILFSRIEKQINKMECPTFQKRLKSRFKQLMNTEEVVLEDRPHRKRGYIRKKMVKLIEYCWPFLYHLCIQFIDVHNLFERGVMTKWEFGKLVNVLWQVSRKRICVVLLHNTHRSIERCLIGSRCLSLVVPELTKAEFMARATMKIKEKMQSLPNLLLAESEKFDMNNPWLNKKKVKRVEKGFSFSQQQSQAPKREKSTRKEGTDPVRQRDAFLAFREKMENLHSLREGEQSFEVDWEQRERAKTKRRGEVRDQDIRTFVSVYQTIHWRNVAPKARVGMIQSAVEWFFKCGGDGKKYTRYMTRINKKLNDASESEQSTRDIKQLTWMEQTVLVSAFFASYYKDVNCILGGNQKRAYRNKRCFSMRKMIKFYHYFAVYEDFGPSENLCWIFSAFNRCVTKGWIEVLSRNARVNLRKRIDNYRRIRRGPNNAQQQRLSNTRIVNVPVTWRGLYNVKFDKSVCKKIMRMTPKHRNSKGDEPTLMGSEYTVFFANKRKASIPKKKKKKNSRAAAAGRKRQQGNQRRRKTRKHVH